MCIGDLPESLSQAMLVGTMLVGRLGVHVIGYSLGGAMADQLPNKLKQI